MYIGDEHILLTSQQPFYHQGIHQQYAMYPSGVTYSINPNQAASTGTLDYTVVPAQQLYQYPIYYSNTFPEHQVFEVHSLFSNSISINVLGTLPNFNFNPLYSGFVLTISHPNCPIFRWRGSKFFESR